MFKYLLPKSEEQIEKLFDNLNQKELENLWRQTESYEVCALIEKRLRPLYENEIDMWRSLVGDKVFNQNKDIWLAMGASNKGQKTLQLLENNLLSIE